MLHRVDASSFVAAAAVFCAASSGFAAVVSWTNGAGGLWSDDENWSSPKIPEPTDDLNFFLANTYAVTLDKDYENRMMKVRHGHVTFDLGGFSHATTLPAGSFPIVDFVVGDVAGDASVTYLNGTVNHKDVWIGGVPGGATPAGVSAGLTYGAGATLNATRLFLWGTTFGRLEFRDGAVATIANLITTPSAGAAIATNEIIVTGLGTSVTTPTIRAAQNKHTDVVVSDGAVVTLSDGIDFLHGGSLTIDNATLTTGRLSDSFALSGELEVRVVNAGSLMSTGSFTELGHHDATVEVSGVDSRWVAQANISIGHSGTATVEVTDGGEFRMLGNTAAIGRHAGSFGEAVVSGASMSADTGDAVRSNIFLRSARIGDAGEGVLRILDGAWADSASGIDFLAATLGHATTGVGHVLVSGSGSEWLSTVVTNNVPLTVGRAGHGIFEVADEGHARLYWDSMILGEMGGSRGELIVRDAGTLVDVGDQNAFGNAGLVVVGRGGEGVAAVSHGANMVSDGLTIGELAGSDGLVDVRADGSRWTIRRNDLVVGGEGIGVLNIERGGLVEVLNGAVTVGANGRITGNGVLITPGVVNDGVVTPGGGDDPLEINGDYEQTKNGAFEYTLGTEKSPRGDDAFDGLLVTGDATLAGALNVVLADGFTPEPGVFDLLRAASIDGEFDTELFPKARGVLSYSVEYTETTVRLIVVPAPGAAAAALGALGLTTRRRKR